MKYIFETADVEKESSILFKKEQEFRLFEDVTPDNKPLTSMLPLLFTDLQIQSLQAEPAFNSEHYSFLIKIPGGKGLYDRISRT